MTHSNTPRLYRALISAAMVAAGSAFLPAAAASQQPVAAASPNDPGVIKARADSTRLPYTAADIHFMSGMISHHAQAIVMSRMAPTHGANDEVRRLAERIINAQTDEIKLMQQWLRDRRQPVPEAKPGPMKMMMNGMEHDMLMPGMLSDAQMKELDAATGSDFDRLFLSYMIQHHRGATSMVKELFESYGAGQDEIVFKFASDVNVDQTTEIGRMEKMLAGVVFGVRVP
jgi:uncharacterized protein (DUF305 family)